jgi:hypothetical protein
LQCRRVGKYLLEQPNLQSVRNVFVQRVEVKLDVLLK